MVENDSGQQRPPEDQNERLIIVPGNPLAVRLQVILTTIRQLAMYGFSPMHYHAYESREVPSTDDSE